METIKPGKYVELVYKLTATGSDGSVFTMEFTEQRPDRFVYGAVHDLLTKFQEILLDKPQGYEFGFTLSPKETEAEFGDRDEEAVITLDKSIFVVNGKFDSKTVAPGKILPMMTEDGYQIQGMVIDVTADKVTMDFNHPFAAKTVAYAGYVKTVRDATDEDMPQHSCGCGCDHHHHHDDCDCNHDHHHHHGDDCSCDCDDCDGCH